MYTKENWNPNVYNININYDDIPSNRHIPLTNEAEEVANRALPMSQKNFIKFQTSEVTDINQVNVTSDCFCTVHNITETITPANLVDIKNGAINNSGNLEANTNVKCTAKTSLIYLSTITSIIANAKAIGVFYEIYSIDNELLKQSSSNIIDITDIKAPIIYIKIIINPGSYWTNFEEFTDETYNIKQV
jgi:hypothetical protein